MRTKVKSAEWGANKERTAILAKVRRMLSKNDPRGACKMFIDGEALETWLLQRNERYQKRKGGLGK